MFSQADVDSLPSAYEKECLDLLQYLPQTSRGASIGEPAAETGRTSLSSDTLCDDRRGACQPSSGGGSRDLPKVGQTSKRLRNKEVNRRSQRRYSRERKCDLQTLIAFRSIASAHRPITK